MAVTVTVVLAAAHLFIADVEATIDADVSAVIPHGLGATAPLVAVVTPLDQAPAEISAWAVQALDATNVTVQKSVTAGSGAVGDQVRVMVALPHSLFL